MTISHGKVNIRNRIHSVIIEARTTNEPTPTSLLCSKIKRLHRCLTEERVESKFVFGGDKKGHFVSPSCSSVDLEITL